MNIAKAWAVLRGKKRHAGAIMAIAPLLLQMLGIESAETEQIYRALEALGVIVFGIGWVDKGSDVIVQRLRKK